MVISSDFLYLFCCSSDDYKTLGLVDKLSKFVNTLRIFH